MLKKKSSGYRPNLGVQGRKLIPLWLSSTCHGKPKKTKVNSLFSELACPQILYFGLNSSRSQAFTAKCYRGAWNEKATGLAGERLVRSNSWGCGILILTA